MNTNDKLCLSVPEIAVLLGVSRPTAYELANRADFPAIHIGKRILVPRAALERWLLEQSDKAGG